MTRAVIAALVVALTPAVVRADPSDQAPFQLIRADETYAYLADPARRTHAFDLLRYIPVGSADCCYLSLGGEVRLRIDDFDAARFGVGTTKDAYSLLRILLHGDLHLGERVRVYAELGDHLAIAKAAPFAVSDRDRLDVQNLFVDALVDPEEHLRLRIGRQELQFNAAQRFVSVREGPNLRQSFEGVRATWTSNGWRVDGFATRPVAAKTGAFDDAPDRGQAFSGIYVSRQATLGGAKLSLDGYAFEYNKRQSTYGAVVGREHRESYGLRVAGQRGPWDFDWEAGAESAV